MAIERGEDAEEYEAARYISLLSFEYFNLENNTKEKWKISFNSFFKYVENHSSLCSRLICL